MEGTSASMDSKARVTSEYKNISLEETLKSLEASTDGLTESGQASDLEYSEIMK